MTRLWNCPALLCSRQWWKEFLDEMLTVPPALEEQFIRLLLALELAIMLLCAQQLGI